MANISDFSIEVTDGAYWVLLDEIIRHSEKLGNGVYSYISPSEDDEGKGFTIDYIREEKREKLYISGEGRWFAATKHIESIFVEFGLTGRITDIEPGGNFFVLYEFIDGVLVKEVEDEYFSEESVSYIDDENYWYENYADYLVSCIQDGEDEEFVAQFCKLLDTTRDALVSELL